MLELIISKKTSLSVSPSEFINKILVELFILRSSLISFILLSFKIASNPPNPAWD